MWGGTMDRAFPVEACVPRRENDAELKSREPRPEDPAGVSAANEVMPLSANAMASTAPETGSAAQRSIGKRLVDPHARRRLFEAALDGVLILDGTTGAITDANPFVVELLGYRREELLGKAFWELSQPENADAAKRAFRRLLAKRYLQHEDLPLATKGGLPIGVEVSGIIYRVNGEDVVQCNIRRRKDAGRLEPSPRHPQSLGEAGQFVGGVAHDFNHLMGVILGYCEALEAQAELPEPVLKTILEIHNAGVSARNLTQRLLAFSRGQAPQPMAVDLNEAVHRMVKILGRTIGEKVQLKNSLGGGLGKIAADPTQIDRVLMNLAMNARDAMPDGGELAIETANAEIDEAAAGQDPSLKPGRYVLLTVSDTGQGMDLETRSRIFEPYFSTKAASQGTGLGLSTVFAIVKQCGGSIGVCSEPGAGTTFKVYFPQCGEVSPAAAGEKPTTLPGGAETILLVEDSAALRGLMRRILEERGYAVLESGDPAEALRMAEEHEGPLPLMIADLILPGFSGSVLAERLAAIRPQTKVLYSSGYSQESVAQSHPLGQNPAFLEKPFTREDLLGKVRQILDSQG
jgi:PAS domain S-box-containing protein